VRIAREDIADFRRSRGSTAAALLDERERATLEKLRRDGFVVVENFWDRDRALALRDRLESELAEGSDRDYDGGAYLRFWDNRAHDQGVRRLYHVDKLAPELKEFRHDPFIFRVIEAYYGMPFYSGMMMFQHNTQTNENTRTFHVDGFDKEFKAFLYLDDVDEGNGPFAYVPGTHKKWLSRLKKLTFGNKNEALTTYFEHEVDTKAERLVLGKAGTLILSDVRGIHRGTPQSDRSRSVLVNYIVKHEHELLLDR
jgi:ectoine hydroxylase-related dioxygenase (phytanoyl-CoA dioxygenase family)